MTSRGIVREWHREEGWGIIDSDDTPGGCWAHFSTLQVPGYRSVSQGQSVTFEFEDGWQDGFHHRALCVCVDGVDPRDPETHPGDCSALRGQLIAQDGPTRRDD